MAGAKLTQMDLARPKSVACRGMQQSGCWLAARQAAPRFALLGTDGLG